MRPYHRQQGVVGCIVLTLALLLSLFGPAQTQPVHAQTTFPIVQTFRNANAPGWLLSGKPSGPAVLTASTDGAGNGWLRLTPAANDRAGTAIYNTAFPSTDGIVVRFTYATWGGSGADGFSFFLLDGSTVSPQPGPSGGALGYSKIQSTPGLTNAYVGIGFDEFGNYSSDSALGTTTGTGGSTSAVPNSIVLRGSGNDTTGYRYLTGKRVTQGISTGSRAGARRVEIVILAGKITVKVDYGNGFVTEINEYNLTTAPGQAALPPTLKLGFSAATGGQTNNHEIRDVEVRKPADLGVSISGSKSSAARGDALQFTVTVNNNNVNDANNVSVLLPSLGFSYGNWTCTASTGSSCPSGNGNTLNVTSLLKGGTATFTVNATVSSGAGEGAVPVTAELGTNASDVTDTNEANNRATTTVTVPKVLEIGATTAISWTEDSPAKFIDPNLAINSATQLSAARVAINAGYQQGADVLSIAGSTATSGTVGSLAWVWDATKGELRLSGNGSDGDYQAALRQVSFRNISQNPTGGARTVRFSLGSGLQYAGNGHFYEFVPHVLPWDQARSEAASKSYFGTQGYLVTVTDAGETDFIRTKLDERGGWIGASDSATQNTWRWVTGPEGTEDGGRGRIFWNGTANGTAAGYANWNPGEPNASGDAAYFIKKDCSFAGCQFGKWDDVSNNSTSAVDGYVVEYGGMPSDPSVTLAGDVTVNVIPVNDNPTDVALDKANVDENLAPNALVGSFSATDVDGGPTYSYALVSGPGADDNSRFSINGTQLKTGITFDFETKNSYTIRVRVSDGNGGSFEKIFAIQINNVDVTPSFSPFPPLPVKYGSDFHYAALAGGEGPNPMTYSATGLPAGLVINPATGEISGAPGLAGTFPVTITANNGASNPGPATGSINVTIVVEKAKLTAKAKDQTVKFGNPIPLEILYSGFLLGDDVTDLDQPGQLTYPGAPGDPAVGSYSITFSTLPSDNNYDFVLEPGKLEVVSKDIPPITWPTPADIVYGTPLGGAQFNATSTITGTFVYSPSAGTVLGTGTGQLLQAAFTPGDDFNYAPILVSNQITVTKAPLTITADDMTLYVGASTIPTPTASYAGFVNGDGPDDLDQPVQFSTTANGTSRKGRFVIQPSGAQDANYAITFVSGTLNLILPPAAPHFVSPLPAAGEYGLSYHHTFLATGNPLAMTYTVISGTLPPGLTLNTNTGLLDGTPTQAGSYSFTVEAANGVAPAATQDVTLVIAKAPLVIQAEDKTVIQGQPMPAFTALYKGFRGGDTQAVLDTDVTLQTNAADTNTLGDFDITQNGGSPASDDNYAIQFNTGRLHVTDKLIPVITWANPAAITYGARLGATQLNATANVAGTFTYAPVSGALLQAGKGELLEVTFAPDDLGTYVPVKKTVQIDVNPAPLTITADNQTIQAGDSLPWLTYSVTGYVDKKSKSHLESPPQISTSGNPNLAGVYPIVVSGAKSNNYTIAYVNGTLTVQALCTVERSSTGAPGSTFPYVARGFAPGEEITIAVDGQDIGTVQADTNGQVRAALYLDPGAAVGQHTVTNSGAGTSSACQVTLDASAALLPDNADRVTVVGRPVGPDSTVPFVIRGCQPNEQVSVLVNGLTTDSALADASGTLEGRMFVGDVPDNARFTIGAQCAATDHDLLLLTKVGAPKQAAPGSGPVLEPIASGPGAYIPFTPCGFQPGEVVDVLVDGKKVGTATADGSGCLQTTVLLDPNTPPGIHEIQAGTAKKQVMIATDGLQRPNPGNAPVLTNTDTVAAPGSSFPVTAGGYQPGEQVAVYLGGKKIGEVTADKDGNIQILVKPDPNVASGTLPISMVGRTSGAVTSSQITVDPNGPLRHDNGNVPVLTQILEFYLPIIRLAP